MNNLLLKRDLTNEQLSMVQAELQKKEKSKGITWAMWFFFGGVGGHRYYLGDIGKAILMTITFGGLGVWTLIDAFSLNKKIENKNNEIELEAIQQVMLLGNNNKKEEVAAEEDQTEK